MLTYVLVNIFFVIVKAAANDNCTTANNKPGICISIHSCSYLPEAHATSQRDSAELARKSTCGLNGTDPLVCCESTLINKTELEVVPFEKLSSTKKICGRQHSDDYYHTWNDTIINEFPWLATMKYKRKGEDPSTDKVSNPYRCSGSLINNQYVLTAGQCVTDPHLEIIFVRLGEYNIVNDTDCIEDVDVYECSDPVQDFGIDKIITHPDYSRRSRLNDIALIKLNRTVWYSDYIRPICLPLPGKRKATVGDILVTSGWGKISSRSRVDIKTKYYVSWVTADECEQRYENASTKLHIEENRFCTLYLKNNSDYFCNGDGGGPVMFSHRNRWHQEGIISAGPTSCSIKYPLIHTYVTFYLKWIEDNIE